MIRINLLPHREAKRKQNKIAFFRLLGVAGAFAAVVAFLIWGFIDHMVSNQDDRNTTIKNRITELDKDIAEIASLKDDIAALKARQQAVEDLQSDRNQPVYLFDELVKQVPEGIFLRSFKQEGQKVVLVGTAQSNDRVSDLMRNISDNSPWLEKPELVEIKAGTLGQGRDTKRVFEFSMNVGIKRPRDAEKKDDKDGKGAAATAAASAPVAAGTPATPAASAPPAASAAPAKAASAANAGSAPKKP